MNDRESIIRELKGTIEKQRRIIEQLMTTVEQLREENARLTKHGPRYFTFLDHPDLEPTNNVAEQQIRQCVLSRRVTQGVHGEKGQRFGERIWTVLATLRRRKQDAFAFLLAAA